VQGKLLGVLDLDSPVPARFDEADAAGLDAAVQNLLAGSDMARVCDAIE
jgi:L-methionine (R)-S-oxide reductase